MTDPQDVSTEVGALAVKYEMKVFAHRNPNCHEWHFRWRHGLEHTRSVNIPRSFELDTIEAILRANLVRFKADAGFGGGP